MEMIMCPVDLNNCRHVRSGAICWCRYVMYAQVFGHTQFRKPKAFHRTWAISEKSGAQLLFILEHWHILELIREKKVESDRHIWGFLLQKSDSQNPRSDRQSHSQPAMVPSRLLTGTHERKSCQWLRAGFGIRQIWLWALVLPLNCLADFQQDISSHPIFVFFFVNASSQDSLCRIKRDNMGPEW